MFRKTRAYVFAAASLAIILSMTLPSWGQNLSSQTQVPSRITSAVDNAVRTAVSHSTHPFAQAKFDRGPVDPALPMQRMILMLGPSAEQEQQLRTFLDSQQTKGSPDYHHWLTPEEFGQKFGPSPQDVQQVTNWLAQAGFRVGAVAKSGRWVEFSGTAAQVNHAFQTEMRNYQGTDRMHIANASDISIPAALAPVVRGVSLHDFFKKPLHRNNGIVHGVPDGTNPNATLHDQNGNVVHALSPGDFASIYDLNPLYNASQNGAGQTIAVVARSDIDLNDVSDFQSVFFGRTLITPTILLNGPDPGDVQGDDVEATLDTEWSQAVAPGAAVNVVISSSTATTDGVDLSYTYIVDNNLAQIMSISFGLCEVGLGTQENQFINSLAQQAAAQGISVFVSAGDDGAAACDDPNGTLATGPNPTVSGLASSPFDTAVGGTEFNETQGGGDATFWNTANSSTLVSVKGYIPEMVWNESCSIASCGIANANLFAGSGGTSSIYPTPSYQASTGIPGLNFSNRALPDVSLAAAGGHDGYLLCFQRVCQAGPNQAFFIIGGTSASSPSMAGIMAVINQKTANTRQGLANYVLYSLAKAETFTNCNSNSRTNPATPDPAACVFNDVTAGNNNVPGATGFSAGTGFDLVTGLGSVDANNLANKWPGSFTGSQTSLTITSPALVAGTLTITHGQPVTVTVTVQKSGGTPGPTGTVALETDIPQPPALASNVTVGSGVLVGGSFSGTFNNLPGGPFGTYNLRAHYAGDGTFGSSDSSLIPTNVSPEPSTTSLSSFVLTSGGSLTPGTTITYGGFLDLRTVVSSMNNTSPPDGFPKGGIKLNDNGSALGQLELASGVPSAPGSQAEFINCFTSLSFPTNTPCLTVGSHPISVNYLGDPSFSASSTAGTTTITVTKATPGTAISVNPGTANFNQQITLQAIILAAGPILPTGTVQFFQGTTALGSPVNVLPGTATSTATLQTTLTGSGAQTVSGQYSGDSVYTAATVGPGSVTILAPFNFSAPTTSQTIPAGGTATYNVTLNGVGGFNGQVNFACAGAPGGATCAVSPNPANLSSSTTTVPLTVTVTNTTNARLGPSLFRTLPVFAVVFAGLLWGARKKSRKSLLMVLALGLILGVVSCGGGGGSPPIHKNPTLATLTVTGTSGSATNTINLSLTITH